MNNKRGFTLIELLVVIGIIGVLAVMGVTFFNIAKTKARKAKAQHEIATIEKTIGMLVNDANSWPGHQTPNQINPVNNNEICSDGCGFNLSSPEAGIMASDGNYANWSGPYMPQMPVDPWGHDYFFDTDYRITMDDKPCAGSPSCINAAVVESYGPDGLGNNQYTSDDIIKIMTK